MSTQNICFCGQEKYQYFLAEKNALISGAMIIHLGPVVQN